MKNNKILSCAIRGFYCILGVLISFQSCNAEGLVSPEPAGVSSDGTYFTIQVSAVSQENNAQSLEKLLSSKGYAAYIVEDKDTERLLYRVCIGQYKTKAAAQSEAKTFYDNEKMSYVIVPLKNSTGSSSSAQALSVNKVEVAEKDEIVAKPAASKEQAQDKSISAEGKNSSASTHIDKNIQKNSKSTPQDLKTHTALNIFEGLPWKVYLSLKPQLNWKLYYEDNIASTTKNKLSDFSNRYTPSFELDITSDLLTITGVSQIEIIEYTHEREWNTVDQDHLLSATYTPDQRSKITLSGNYVVSSDPDRYYVQPSGETGSVALEGSYVVKKNKTKSKSGGLQYGYKLSPRSDVKFLLSYSTFDTGVSGDANFYMSNVNYIYKLNRAMDLNLALLFNAFDFSFDEAASAEDLQYLEDLISGGYYTVSLGSKYKSESYSVNGGGTYKFGNHCKLDFSLGYNYAKNDVTQKYSDPETGVTVSDRKKTDGDAVIFLLKLEKIFSYTTIGIQANQTLGTNSNTGASYNQRYITGTGAYKFTRRFEGMIRISYNTYKEDEDDFGNEIDRTIWYLTSSLNYDYAKWLRVSLSHSYSYNKDDIYNSKVTRNTVYLSFVFKPLRPYIIR